MKKQLHGMKKWWIAVGICKKISSCIKKKLQQEEEKKTPTHMEP